MVFKENSQLIDTDNNNDDVSENPSGPLWYYGSLRGRHSNR